MNFLSQLYGRLIPMVASLIGYAEYCGDANELCHGFGRSLAPNIHIIKYGAQV